tara:strand:- start:161 stop:1510 length:1350 start_codon:yes stop_codon:yes gene_type:complete
MKVLHKYLLKEMLLPFIFSLLIITFLLFINFLIRAVDRFLGKGLDFFIIIEYLFLNLAWIIALSVPMAVLLTSLMTFGRMSEDNEIDAFKSSGISYYSLMISPLFFGIFITLILILFNNYILPEMNFKARLLSGDIYKKRPMMNIEPGIFIDALPNYNIIIGGKSNGVMSDVRIFSKVNNKSQVSIYAKTGNINTLSNAFLLTLYNGEIHELENDQYNNYRRIIFKKHNIKIPADNILLNRRDSSNRTDREMTIPMIKEKVASYNKRINVVKSRIEGIFYKTTNDSLLPKTFDEGDYILKNIQIDLTEDSSLTKAQISRKKRLIRNFERQIKNEYSLLKSYMKGKNKYLVEIYKKYSIPFACILFVLIGVPIGILAKKGGFSISILLSFGFFLIYYLMLIGGEELADRNKVPALICMWSPNAIFLIFALYFNIITIKEKPPKLIFLLKK